MSDYSNYDNHESEESRARQRSTQQGQQLTQEQTESTSLEGSLANASQILSSQAIAGRGNSQARTGAMQAMQGTHGNRAVQRFIQRTAATDAVPVQRADLSDMYAMLMGRGISDSNSSPIGGPVGGGLPDMDFKWNDQGGLDGEAEFGPYSGHQDLDANGVPISVDAGKANLRLGKWRDGDNTRYGGKLGGGGAKGDVNKDGPFSGDFGFGTASAEASGGDDGFTIGAGANVVEGSVTTAPPNADSRNDEQSRFGLSWGSGMAGRGHWGDKDDDGFREYGFGFDVGPVSADIKTEDPLRTGSKFLMNSLVPDFAKPLTTPFNAYMDNVAPDSNLTQDAYNKVADVGEDIYEGGSNLGHEAYETGEEVYEGAEKMYDKAKEYIPDIKMPAIEANPLNWF